jgi:hypothetical protein
MTHRLFFGLVAFLVWMVVEKIRRHETIAETVYGGYAVPVLF